MGKLVTKRGQPYEYEYIDDTGAVRPLVSVSQVRQVMWPKTVPLNNLDALQRGQRLHRWWALHLGSRAGLCATPPLVPGEEASCLALQDWAERTQAQPLRLEEAAPNLRVGYAGCPDAQVVLERGVIALLDLKTGSPTPTDAIQLLAYRELEGYRESQRLLNLYLAEGRVRVVERAPDPHAWAAFLSALNLLTWRLAHVHHSS